MKFHAFARLSFLNERRLALVFLAYLQVYRAIA